MGWLIGTPLARILRMNRSLAVFLALFSVACSSTVSIRDYGNEEDSGKPDSEPVGVAPPDADCCRQDAHEEGATKPGQPPVEEDDAGTPEAGCCDDVGTSEKDSGSTEDSAPIEKEAGVDSEVAEDSGGADSEVEAEPSVDSGPDSDAPDTRFDAHDSGTLDVKVDSRETGLDAAVDSPAGDPCPTESAYTCTGDQTYVCTSGQWQKYGGVCNFGCHQPSTDGGLDAGEAGSDPELNRCNCHGDWTLAVDPPNGIPQGFIDHLGKTWTVTGASSTGDYRNWCANQASSFDPKWRMPTIADLEAVSTQKEEAATEYCPGNLSAEAAPTDFIVPQAFFQALSGYPISVLTYWKIATSTPETGGHYYFDPITGFEVLPDWASIHISVVCVKDP